MVETVSQAGEFGLIRRIDAIVKNEGVSVPSFTRGIGDDCAAFQPRPGFDLLVTCDSMVENRHYLPRFMSPYDMGRRAMVQNISDIGAMGGLPCYALVSLGLRSDTAVEDVENMYRGFLAELNPMKAAIIGGNVTGTSHANFIDITLIGEVETGKMVGRNTARTGDVILVTGFPGQSAAGLALLLERPHEAREYESLVNAYQRPVHRALEGNALAELGLVTAMIDTSDGLLGDLGHICEESQLGAVLFEEQLPEAPDLKRFCRYTGQEPLDFILKESDDYELILTCTSEQVSAVRNAVFKIGRLEVTEIGRMTEKEGDIELIDREGKARKTGFTGWDHFAK